MQICHQHIVTSLALELENACSLDILLVRMEHLTVFVSRDVIFREGEFPFKKENVILAKKNIGETNNLNFGLVNPADCDYQTTPQFSLTPTTTPITSPSQSSDSLFSISQTPNSDHINLHNDPNSLNSPSQSENHTHSSSDLSIPSEEHLPVRRSNRPK